MGSRLNQSAASLFHITSSLQPDYLNVQSSSGIGCIVDHLERESQIIFLSIYTLISVFSTFEAFITPVLP